MKIIGGILKGFFFLFIAAILLPLFFGGNTLKQTGADGVQTSAANQLLDKRFTVSVTGDPGLAFTGAVMCSHADGNNSSESVEGITPKTFTCSGSIVSATAQKTSEGSGTLVLQILSQDGAVLNKSKTSAAFGVVSAASN